MMKKPIRHLLAALLFGLAGITLSAQDVQVSYLEGKVQVKTNAAWKELNIGDKLAADAVFELGKNASLELQAGGSSFNINQAGTYQLKDVLAARQKNESSGVAKSLRSTFTNMMDSGSAKQRSNVAGVRAANQSEGGSNWVTSDTQVLIESGKALLQSSQYTDALARFLGAREEALDEELPEVQYLLAFTLAQMGDYRRAAKELPDMVVVPDADWAGDCILLQARLLEDSYAWAQAVSLLTTQGSFLANDASRGPLYHFLLGLAWLNSGNTANARTALTKVSNQSPDSELGKAAAALLKN